MILDTKIDQIKANGTQCMANGMIVEPHSLVFLGYIIWVNSFIIIIAFSLKLA